MVNRDKSLDISDREAAIRYDKVAVEYVKKRYHLGI